MSEEPLPWPGSLQRTAHFTLGLRKSEQSGRDAGTSAMSGTNSPCDSRDEGTVNRRAWLEQNGCWEQRQMRPGY